MKSKIIRILKDISKELQLFLHNNNNLCVNRNRKNDIIDAILYKLYYTDITMTQEKVAIKLNKFKKKTKKCSRQSLVKKEQKLSISFYEKLSVLLSDQIKKHTKQKNTKQIIAVDGVYSTFLKSLEKDGHKTNKNNESVTPLITGMFNVTYNCPVTLDLAKDKNERKGFIDFIKNKDIYKGSIFVFDRGYVSKKLFKFMNDNDMFYICRLRDNTTYVSNKNNNIIYENGYKLRAIRYTINGKLYYMATNLLDYNIQTIKNIYHDRWNVEEYFKYIKQNMKLAKMNEKRAKDIKKSIISQLIVSQITFLFVNLNKQSDNKLIVNKSILTNGIYDRFLYYFFNNIKFTKYFILNFIKIYIKIIHSNKGKSFPRTCKRANYRWYFKKYFKNAKSKTM